MGLMVSKKLRYSRDGVYQHWCPGCNERHEYHVGNPNSSGAQWSWDGSVEMPTFSPSMHITTSIPDGDYAELAAKKRADPNWQMPYKRVTRCHYFLTAGMLQFCSDSPHALSGQTVPLPDWPASRL